MKRALSRLLQVYSRNRSYPKLKYTVEYTIGCSRRRGSSLKRSLLSGAKRIALPGGTRSSFPIFSSMTSSFNRGLVNTIFRNTPRKSPTCERR